MEPQKKRKMNRLSPKKGSPIEETEPPKRKRGRPKKSEVVIERKPIEQKLEENQIKVVLGRKPSLDNFKKLVEVSGGSQVAIAKALKVTRSAVNKWIKEDKEFKTAMDDANAVLVDLAKESLVDLLKAGDRHATMFVLDRLAKKEGFGNQISITDKSKFDEQVKQMTDEELLEELERNHRRIQKANGIS